MLLPVQQRQQPWRGPPPQAAGGVGAVVGPAFAVLGAFALGRAIGEGLLDLWQWANQALREVPLEPNDGQVDTWPTPKDGQVVTYNWAWVSHGYFQPWYEERVYRSTNEIPSVSSDGENYFYEGFGRATISWGGSSPGSTNGGLPGYLRLKSFTTSNGQPPEVPTTQVGTPIDRSPVLDALNRARESVGMDTSVPLAFIPPAQPVIPSAPSRAPVVVPAPIIAPAPAPRPAVPAGAPGRAPAPGTLPQITPAPGAAPAPQPQPSTFPQIDPARPPLPIGPNGVPVAPAAPVVPVTPPDVINYPGLTVGDPAARPRPDLDSIAKELGRQEQKLAGLLGGLGYPEAFDRLLDLISSINGGTTYTLHPPCGTDANGDPLPPVEVIVPPSIGDSSAIINRLDALAMLLDEHKAMRQPICKGKPTGRPVTVTFVEADP